jgi:hypothetical protein
MQYVCRQRLGKHISAYRTVLCNAVTSSTIQTFFPWGLCRGLIREVISEARSRLTVGRNINLTLNIRGLNLAAVKHTTVQVSRLPL